MHTPMPKIIAHRGASGDAPENTLAAIRLAAEHGASWIEIDANISRDGIPVLHHDDGLNRCSNGSGLVIENTWQQLSTLDSGSWFSETYKGEPVCTLDQCLDLAEELGLSINIEIKPCSGWELPTTDAIAACLKQRSKLPELVISSFSHIAMLRSAELLDFLPRASLFLVAPPDWRQLTTEAGSGSINLHGNSLLDATAVKQFHDANLSVYCYTVNTVKQAQSLFEIGVDGVFSNYPKLMLNTFSPS